MNMPSAAQSAATKFRWRQLRDYVSGSFAQWAVDDVSVDVDVLNPAVVLTSPSKGNRATLVTVVAQFSQEVLGFDAQDVLVHNGAPSPPPQRPSACPRVFCARSLAVSRLSILGRVGRMGVEGTHASGNLRRQERVGGWG